MIFDPFFLEGGSETLYVLPPASCVFASRNRFRNRKQLARKGVENSSEVVVFYRTPRVP